jgi:hypothetical protein
MADQVLQIGTAHRIAAGEHQQRGLWLEPAYLIDQLEAFLGRELARIAARDGVGAAVDARQTAGPRDFPDDEERSAVEVDQRQINRWTHQQRIPRLRDSEVRRQRSDRRNRHRTAQHFDTIVAYITPTAVLSPRGF